MNSMTISGHLVETMSSREIAELTSKNHADVMRDVRSMVDALTKAGLLSCAESTTYTGKDGRQYSQYLLDKNTCLNLLLGYDPGARMRVVVRWQELEAEKAPRLPTTYLDALRAHLESEEKAEALLIERDEAIRTKAEIGSRREATAMATASVKAKEVNRLKHELGRNQLHATIIAVENATHRIFGTQAWRPLKKYCEDNGLTPSSVADPRYGAVKAWPGSAWKSAYDIDLSKLFQGSAAHE